LGSNRKKGKSKKPAPIHVPVLSDRAVVTLFADYVYRELGDAGLTHHEFVDELVTGFYEDYNASSNTDIVERLNALAGTDYIHPEVTE